MPKMKYFFVMLSTAKMNFVKAKNPIRATVKLSIHTKISLFFLFPRQ